MIAGEALMGLVTGWFYYKEWKLPVAFTEPSYIVGMLVMAGLGAILIQSPLANAGRPEDPAPPAVIM